MSDTNRASSGAASVVVVQAMQNRRSDNLCFKLAGGGRRRNWDRHGLSDSLVWSGMIEVAELLSHVE